MLEPHVPGRASVGALAQALGWRTELAESVTDLHTRMRQRMACQQLPDSVVIESEPHNGAALQALTVFKASQPAGSLPPILLVLADQRGGNGSPGPGSLADGVIRRPPTAAGLFNAISQALVARGGSHHKLTQLTHLEAANACCLPGVRVLVVDDCSVNRDVARRILEREGAQVTACVDGREALAALREGLTADLVLMDVQMPELDGYATTRQIRGELALTQLPILALTSGALKAEQQRALESGMDEFITKPLNPLALIRAVRRHVERVQGHALLLVPRPEQAQASWPAWPHIEGIDSREVSQRLGGDVVLFTVMLDHLLRDFADLADAGPGLSWNEARREQMAARMHRLRGSAAVLGARRVQRMAADVERALKAGAGDAPLDEAMTQLAQALTALDHHSHPWMATQSAGSQPVPDTPPVAPAEPAELQALLALLTHRDLSARKCFHALAAPLDAALGHDNFHRLRDAVEGLDYAQAVALLEAHLAPP